MGKEGERMGREIDAKGRGERIEKGGERNKG